SETFVKEEKTPEQVQELLNDGFLEIAETEYQLLIGNIDGQEYVRTSSGKFEPYVPPAPTQDEINLQIQQRITGDIQDYLDEKAKELNYDSCLSACSYFNTGVEKFDKEGAAFREWRSAVWSKGYQILNECISGQRSSVPDKILLISELPVLEITY
uniref:hypothetical protein n=1 Tax=Parasutterella excrementihominis TaxID=487175 RepID=UPI00242AD76D